MMDKILAAELLGVEPGASVLEISRGYAARHADLSQRERDAPTEALREKYRVALADLDAAVTLLHSSAATTVAPTQIRRALSDTKLADLPSAVAQSGEQAATFEIGSVVGDRYEVKAVLGRGGMGVVYRAHDRHGNEDVALKVLLPQFLASPAARERFLNEVKITRKLSHPNIVRLHDVQRTGSTDFLTMELLEGETLRAAMETRRRQGGTWALAEVKALLKPLCEALHYAHSETVHRDIKPENVWVGKNGSLKLMDFGIAKVMSTSQLTQTGTAMGTAYYMAPEQLKSAATVDGRADQYAVAVLAYELLSGDVPAGKVAALNKAAKGIPAAFSVAIDKALSPNPEQRYPDMAAFAAALGLGSRSGGGSSLALPWRTLGIAAGAVLVLGIGGYLLSNTDLQSLLPQSAEEKQAAYNAAVQLEGEVKDLAEKLRQRAQAAEQQRKDLEQRKRSLEQSVRTAREGKEELQSELTETEHELQLADSGWAIRQRVVHESPKLTELNGLLTLGSRQVQDKLYKEGRGTLTRAKLGFAQLMELDRAGEQLPGLKQTVTAAESAYKASAGQCGRVEPPPLEPANTQKLAREAEQGGDLLTATRLNEGLRDRWANLLKHQIDSSAARFRNVIQLREVIGSERYDHGFNLGQSCVSTERAKWVISETRFKGEVSHHLFLVDIPKQSVKEVTALVSIPGYKVFGASCLEGSERVIINHYDSKAKSTRLVLGEFTNGEFKIADGNYSYRFAVSDARAYENQIDNVEKTFGKVLARDSATGRVEETSFHGLLIRSNRDGTRFLGVRPAAGQQFNRLEDLERNNEAAVLSEKLEPIRAGKIKKGYSLRRVSENMEWVVLKGEGTTGESEIEWLVRNLGDNADFRMVMPSTAAMEDISDSGVVLRRTFESDDEGNYPIALCDRDGGAFRLRASVQVIRFGDVLIHYYQEKKIPRAGKDVYGLMLGTTTLDRN